MASRTELLPTEPYGSLQVHVNTMVKIPATGIAAFVAVLLMR